MGNWAVKRFTPYKFVTAIAKFHRGNAIALTPHGVVSGDEIDYYYSFSVVLR
ncbi:MAG: hypothetical protein HC796_12080 [Synechococcaceae cyanobacterium RL_1_2]|nr:hypothetical protein [Synechococcaceae cyanobacterium RL_1_2]